MSFTVKDFSYDDIVINCNFDTRVSIISDDSGVGKTYLMDILMGYCKNNHIPCKHYDYDHPDIEPQDSGLLLIDRADLFLTNEHLASLKSAGCSSVICMQNSCRLDTSGCGKYVLLPTERSIESKRYR